MKYMEIIQGADVEIPIKIREKFSDDPIDLTGKTITGVLKGCPTNIPLLSTDFVMVNAVLGKMKMKVSATKTALLQKGNQSFEVILVNTAGAKTIVLFENLLEVKGRV